MHEDDDLSPIRSQEEVAKILGICRSTVIKLEKRAMQKLLEDPVLRAIWRDMKLGLE